MSIDDFLLIFHIMESGSFTKAGEIVCLSQSAVSKKIANIEKELGVKLFDRVSRNGVKPTRYLLKIQPHIKNLVEDYNRFLSLIKEEMNEIAIASSTGFRKDILLRIIEEVKKSGSSIRLSIENSDSVVNLVINNKTDCGIIGYPIVNENIICEKLYDQRIVLAGLRDIKEFTLNSLYDIPLILQQKGSGLREFLLSKFKNLGIILDKMNIVIEAGYGNFVKEACVKGMGYAFLPEEEVTTPLKEVWRSDRFIRSFWLITKSPNIANKITSIIEKFHGGG